MLRAGRTENICPDLGTISQSYFYVLLEDRSGTKWCSVRAFSVTLREDVCTCLGPVVPAIRYFWKVYRPFKWGQRGPKLGRHEIVKPLLDSSRSLGGIWSGPIVKCCLYIYLCSVCPCVEIFFRKPEETICSSCNGDLNQTIPIFTDIRGYQFSYCQRTHKTSKGDIRSILSSEILLCEW